MKKIISTILVLFLAKIALATSESKNVDRVVANVNGKPLYESQVAEKIKRFLAFNGMSQDSKFAYENMNPDLKKEVIKNVILSDLVLEDAKKSNTSQDPEYIAVAEFTTNQLLQKIFLENLIKRKITQEKINDEYQKYLKSQSSAEEYKTAHILVKTEDEAKNIRKKIDAGESFEKLAKEYSLDNNKENGGELDFFVKGQMVAPFELAVEKLQIGQISQPIKTDFGYHIIKLIDKRKVKPMSFDDIKEKIEEDLTTQYIQEYINNLEKKNKVEFL